MSQANVTRLVILLIGVALIYMAGWFWGILYLVIAAVVLGWDWLMSMFDPPKRK